jgi:ribulose-phosphate 3-epimerase
MRKIIPLIYALLIEELNEKLSKLLNFSDDFQIDIMDGAFVEEKSFDITELKELPNDKNFEFHLMVAYPLEYIVQLKRLGVKKVIFHDEIEQETGDVINGFKKEGFTVFLATNPSSEPNKIEPYILPAGRQVPKIDGIMLMSVEPGKTGQTFIHSVLAKAKYLREKYPNLVLEIDGGINRENIQEVFDAGINIAGVGSGILKAEDPRKEWEELQKYI